MMEWDPEGIDDDGPSAPGWQFVPGNRWLGHVGENVVIVYAGSGGIETKWEGKGAAWVFVRDRSTGEVLAFHQYAFPDITGTLLVTAVSTDKQEVTMSAGANGVILRWATGVAIESATGAPTAVDVIS